MRVIGYGSTGPDLTNLSADHKYVARYAAPGPIRVPKLVAKIDGRGPGGGTQRMRGIIYSGADSSLVAVGDEIEIPSGSVAQWADLPFPEDGGVLLGAGNYDLGVFAGPSSQGARLYGRNAGSAARHDNTDTYPDGPADPFGASSSGTGDYSLYAPYVTDWVKPDEEVAYYARWPFHEAQLQLVSAVETTYSQVVCGWHGADYDPETGSFCMVRTGGPLADLVGDRLAITCQGRTVYAYCHREADVIEDITLTRRLFLALASLATFELDVEVGVLA